MLTENIYLNPETESVIPAHQQPVAICDWCGDPIYPLDEARRVGATHEIIHSVCWEDYAIDRIEELTEYVDFSLM